ncbi:hypothetical protein HS096_04710 [candidate division WWE3 bacterium]|uniref:Uncharacterized protein n=1 Tax=candidate division WWE3 bacterium TaxID=2053526 RepID=A0A928TQZ5_UNCKA|nr:hypothetical protein [candidate division WWE3 bacterium]
MSETVRMPVCRVRGVFAKDSRKVENPLVTLGKGDRLTYNEASHELRYTSSCMRVTNPQSPDKLVFLEGPLEIACYPGNADDPDHLGTAEVQKLPAAIESIRLLIYAILLGTSAAVSETMDGQNIVWTLV